MGKKATIRPSRTIGYPGQPSWTEGAGKLNMPSTSGSFTDYPLASTWANSGGKIFQGGTSYGDISSRVILWHETSRDDVFLEVYIEIQGTDAGRAVDSQSPWLHVDLVDDKSALLYSCKDFMLLSWECRSYSKMSKFIRINMAPATMKAAKTAIMSHGGFNGDQGCL